MVLVPAHNEALILRHNLMALKCAMPVNGKLLVVADNCTDNTAEIARQCGADVLERFNDQLRGKGYALDAGIKYLAPTHPDIVVIIDADCRINSETLPRLITACLRANRPVQARTLMHAPANATPRLKLAEFAWKLKNEIRPVGMLQLGWPCQLTGTGMAFPWPIIANRPLASKELAEDMELGINLAQAGYAPLFEPTACVDSDFPSVAAAQNTQRTRWEHGHLGMIFTRVPGLLLSGVRTGDLGVIAMAFDLSIPPLALLATVLGIDLLVNELAWWLGIHSVSVVISLATGLLFLLSIMLAWAGWARNVIPFTTLLFIPWYILRKIPHYLRFITKREKNWVRTDRGNQS